MYFLMAPPGETDPGNTAKRFAALSRTPASQSAPIVGEVLGIAARNIRAPPPASRDSSDTDRPEMLHSGSPSTYRTFFADTLHFAFSGFPPRPLSSNCSSKRGLWSRAARRPLLGECDVD